MMATSNKRASRNTERIFLLIISLVLGFVFFQLFDVLQRDFKEVPQRLADGTMMNINEAKPGERMHSLLTRGFYFQDKADIDLVTAVINREDLASKTDLDNTGELNKSKYSINADEAYNKGGETFRKRVKVSRGLLGFSDTDSLLFN
ncbi:MAG: cell cycle protein, partial [Ferruginibacter sp.]|nr:cell cycle protein [Ferruginibacter sp.]